MNSSTSNIKRNSYIWNAVYSGVNALQSAIILFAVSRTGELADAGIITFGFALANLVMLLARYGIRNYQVTDIYEKYSFSDYFYCRICSTGASLLLSVIYLVVMIASGRYTSYKALIILEIIILKLIDAFEGVYTGRLQQKGRLDIGARIGAVRLIISTLAIFIAVLVIKNIPVSLLIGIIVSLLIDIILIPKSRKDVEYGICHVQLPALKKLMAVGLSLCLGTALHNFVGNSPRYLVEIFLTDEVQAVSGYLMMPVFVITILNYFLMQPVVKDIGETWNKKDMGRFKHMVKRHILIICALTLVIGIAGVFLGLPLLSWLYRVSLTQYRLTFVCYLAGGALYTLSEYFMVLLVAARKQNSIIAGCLAAIVINVIAGGYVLGKYGIQGTAVLYIISNLAMLGIFIAIMVRNIHKAQLASG